MNMQDLLDQIDGRMEQLKKQRLAVLKLQEKLEGFTEDISPSLTYDGNIDIDFPKRSQVVKLLTHLKTGKWDKEVNADGKTINYLNKTMSPGFTLRIYGAEPPASCRLVEEEVVIPPQPERIEKRFKMVCKEHELQTT